MTKILLSVFLLLTFNLNAQHWQVTEMAPMPERVSNSAVATGNINGTDYVYSFSGIDSTKLQSGIHLKSYRYNVQADSWDIIPPLPDDTGMGKIAASADRVGDIIYIIGGYYVFPNLSEESSDDVHRYDMATNTYLSDGATIPVPIDDQVQAVWRDSLIYVITGWSDNGNVPDVQIYDPANDTWMMGTSTPNTNNYKSFGSSGVIYNDTIYYFGGARSSGSFGIQRDFRKGIINPNNPTEIEWSIGILDTDVNGYRMAATMSKGSVFWLGGSGNTYNFNGIAYNNNQGVPPLNRSLLFDPASGYYETDESNSLPMDLRALGSVNDTVKYIVGGMVEGQEVTNQVLKLERIGIFVDVEEPMKKEQIKVVPNPVVDRLFLDTGDADLTSSSFEIYNALGQLVLVGEYEESGILVEELDTGVYFLKVGGVSTDFIRR